MDQDGKELLRLGVTVAGKEVLFQFPTYQDWDAYVQDYARLLILLAQNVGDLQMNIELVPQEHFQDWASILAHVVMYKKIKELVDKIFFTYLKPTAKDIEPDKVRSWMSANMPVTHVFYLLYAIMQCEAWLKKKAKAILEATFPEVTQRLTKDTFPKSSMFEPQKSAGGQSFEFV